MTPTRVGRELVRSWTLSRRASSATVRGPGFGDNFVKKVGLRLVCLQIYKAIYIYRHENVHTVVNGVYLGESKFTSKSSQYVHQEICIINIHSYSRYLY